MRISDWSSDVCSSDLRRARSRAAEVEGTHRQLGTRLTDRLCGNDADRFADVDALTTGQVTAIAVRAAAERPLAGDRRTHPHLDDRLARPRIGPPHADDGSGRTSALVSARLLRITQGAPAPHAATQQHIGYGKTW